MVDTNLLTKFTYKEIYDSTLAYFKGDTLATEVWINKYCLKDSFGNFYELNPDHMHRRIAKELARIEAKYPNSIPEEEIYKTLKNFKRIVPQGSPMTGIGNDFQIVSLSNCFVIGNDKDSDSYGGIMKIDQEQVQLMKRRGGVGHDLSHIRPAGTPVKNSALTSTGIVPFMERYSNSTKEVAQDGRRGALMLSVSVKHPDSEKFIDAKLTQGKVTGANISIKITDDFMEAVTRNKEFWQTYPINLKIPLGIEYDELIVNAKENELVHLPNVGYLKKINAQKLWKKIIFNAWKSAEPGILFWDNIMNESIPDCYADKGFRTVTTNPCGEIPLCPYDSCRLLCVNLYGYVIDPFTKNARFNMELFKQDVQIAQRYMDDIIDLEVEKIDAILEKINNDPEDEFIKLYEIHLWKRIKEMTLNGRRTGLGVTAEGDMLAALGYRYGTDEATNFSENLHKTLKLTAYQSSVQMAKERGAFPVWDAEKEKNNPFILRIQQEDFDLWDEMMKYGRRNIALLTIAPTGTASLMTQTTSGIECVFLPVYKRRRKINPQEKDVRIDFVDDEGIAWQEYPVFHLQFETWLEVNGYDINTVKSMTSAQVDEIVKQSPYYKASSADVDWVKKVEMQGKIQKHVDHSISVTVNLPETATEEIVGKVYEMGCQSGCKGITVYREGSRSGVLLSDNDKKDAEFPDVHATKRPKRLKAEIYRFQNNLEKWIAVVGIKDGRPYEIFTGKFENGLSKLPPNVKDCEVVKNIIETDELNEKGEKIKKKRYDIEYIDNDGSKQVHMGLNHAFNPEFWNYAKLISGIMRHRMPVIKLYELIDSLTFKEDYINTWKNGVARVIKRFIKDGEKGKGKCQVCGSENLHFQEGCLKCMNCGSSKCG